MKRAFSGLFLASALLVAPLSVTLAGGSNTKTSPKAAETYTVDPVASKVEWNAEKVTGKHNGTLMLKDGTMTISGGRVTGGLFTVDMTTLKVLDLQDPGMNGKLTGHLKSDDFFSVEKNPTSTFKIISIAPIKGAEAGKPNYTVNGDMTIKGITNRLSFPATIMVTGKQATATGTAKIDRTLYDVKYRSAKFFSDLGDKMISDEFSITFNIVANNVAASGK